MYKKYTSNDIKQFLSEKVISDNEQNGSDYSNLKVSIVIPSFKQGIFIERSILSVLNQNYKNLQLIIIDGGSTDSTISVLDRYDEHIDYRISERDNGQSEALNKGFKVARGDIFGWLNADDLLCPGAISGVVKTFQKYPNATVVFGDYYSIDGNDNIIDLNYSFDYNLFHFVYEGFTMNSQACFWRSTLHKEFGKFDEFLHRTMDYDMLVRFGIIAGEKSFHRISVPLACFRRHADQKTKGADDTVKKEQIYIANKNGFYRKFSVYGHFVRFMYRFRRIYWYIKRGGIKYLISLLFKSLLHRFSIITNFCSSKYSI